MRITMMATLAAVLTGVGGAPNVHAQSNGRLLLYESATGAHAAAEVAFPGRLKLGDGHEGRFPTLAGQAVAHIVATPTGLLVSRGKSASTIQIWPDSSLRISARAPGCTLQRAKLVASGPFLVCYGTDGSAAVGRLSTADGTYLQEFRAPAGTLPHYSHLVATASYLLFYDSASGALAVGQISRNPDNGENYIEVTDIGLAGKGYESILSSSDRLFLHDPLSGRYETARIEIVASGRPGKPDRRLEGRYDRTDKGELGVGLRHAATIEGNVMLYRPDGRYLVGRFDRNDRFHVRDRGRTAPGFEQIVRTGEYLFLLDASGSGKAAIGQITPAGRYREIRTLDVGRYDRVAATDG